MIWRALGIWIIILVLANANGALREFWLIPQLGAPVGRVLSTLALCVLIMLVTWLAIGWVGPATVGQAWSVGALWLALTLGFEFLAGHYLFGRPWSVLLEEYDVSRGRIWVLVLIVVLLAPLWTARMKGLLEAPYR
jgi:hypothetical protein